MSSLVLWIFLPVIFGAMAVFVALFGQSLIIRFGRMVAPQRKPNAE